MWLRSICVSSFSKPVRSGSAGACSVKPCSALSWRKVACSIDWISAVVACTSRRLLRSESKVSAYTVRTLSLTPGRLSAADSLTMSAFSAVRPSTAYTSRSSLPCTERSARMRVLLPSNSACS